MEAGERWRLGCYGGVDENVWCAAGAGDVRMLERTLEEDGDANERDTFGRTPLHHAATHGQCNTLAALLERKQLLLDERDWENGWTALHRAIYGGHVRAVFLLLAHGAWLDGDTPNNLLLSRSSAESKSSALDHEGHSPLDLLSLTLQNKPPPQQQCRHQGDVLSFGKAGYPLGYHLPNASAQFTPRHVSLSPSPSSSLKCLNVAKVAAGKFHSVAVTAQGRVFSWGHGRGGRLGHGDEATAPLPRLVRRIANERVVEVAAGENHTLAITGEGVLYSWGSDRFGQLGHGGNDRHQSTGTAAGQRLRLLPKRVVALRGDRVVAVAAAVAHSACATADGTVFVWGSNKHGQLACQIGLGASGRNAVPRAVSQLRGRTPRCHCVQISAAVACTVALCRVVSAQGLVGTAVWQWGWGSPHPVRVKFGKRESSSSSSSSWNTRRVVIKQISAARNHTAGVSSSGLVFIWGGGADSRGGSSAGPLTHSSTPEVAREMLPHGSAVFVAAAANHTAVLTASGDLFTWGTSESDCGILGQGSGRTWLARPRRVAAVKRAVGVAVGDEHTLVLVSTTIPPKPHADEWRTNMSSADDQDRVPAAAPQPADSEDDLDLSAADFGGPCCATTEEATQPERFTAPSLRHQCERAISRQVSLRSVCTTLAYAEALDAPSLARFCADYIQCNLDAVLSRGLRELRRDSNILDALLESRALDGDESGRAEERGAASAFLSSLGSHVDTAGGEDDGGVDDLPLPRAGRVTTVQAVARAVRSVRKKLARVAELGSSAAAKDELSQDQLEKLSRGPSLERRLALLESTLRVMRNAENQRERLAQEEQQNKDAEATSPPAGFAEHCTKKVEVEAGGVSGEAAVAAPPPPLECLACGVRCSSASALQAHVSGKRHRNRLRRLKESKEKAASSSRCPSSSAASWATAAVRENATPTPVAPPQRARAFSDIMKEDESASSAACEDVVKTPTSPMFSAAAVTPVLGSSPGSMSIAEIMYSQKHRRNKKKSGSSEAWSPTLPATQSASPPRARALSLADIQSEQQDEARRVQRSHSAHAVQHDGHSAMVWGLQEQRPTTHLSIISQMQQDEMKARELQARLDREAAAEMERAGLRGSGNKEQPRRSGSRKPKQKKNVKPKAKSKRRDGPQAEALPNNQQPQRRRRPRRQRQQQQQQQVET